MTEFSVTISDLPDMHVVVLHGELDVVSAAGLADSLAKEAGPALVVDLSGLTFMDCSGVATLVAASNRIRSNPLGQSVPTPYEFGWVPRMAGPVRPHRPVILPLCRGFGPTIYR